MRIIPAIIERSSKVMTKFIIPALALITFALTSGPAYAQEPTETPTVAPTATSTPEPTPLPDGRLTWELRTDSRTVCVEVHQTRGPEDVRDFDLCGDNDDKRLTLDAGRYSFDVRDIPEGWEMDRVTCHGKDASEYTNAGDDEATVIIAPGRSFTCVAWLDALPAEPTATPTRVAVVAATNGRVWCNGKLEDVKPGQVYPCLPPLSAPVPTATPAPVPTSTPVRIMPPSTGDGGLR